MDKEQVLHTLRVFLKAASATENALKNNMKKNNINPTEFMVLELLNTKEKMPVNDIAKKINITSGSMTYVSTQLINKGLIVRNQCQTDSRLFYLSLSEKGRSLIEKAFLKHAEFIFEMFEGFTEEELEIYSQLNKKLGYKADSLK